MSEHPVQDDERAPCPRRPSLGAQSVSTVVPSPSSPSDNPPENLTHDPLSTRLTVPQPPRRPRRLSSVQVPESLQKGTIMTKVSMKKQKAFSFRLDADLGQIVWESKKYKIIPIENIKEIRLGVDSRFYRAQFQLPSNVEDRWLTVIYVLDGRYRTLHLMAQTAEICQMWENSLKELHSIRLLLMRGLGNAEMRESLWVKQYWTGADEEGDQRLSFDEVVKFCRGLGINSSEEDLERRFVHASQGKPYLDFEDFRAFVKLLKSRPEVERLYKKLISRSESEVFDFDVFQCFMRNTQRSYLPDADLQAIFDKHSVYPSAAVKNPTSTSIVVSPPNEITKSSPSSNHAATTSKPTMTVETFTAFLLSSENSAYSDVHRGIWHDMTRPLCEYFISSSHNTYLVGHQLVGESTIEGYIRALLQGCRSVEVDIYDGDNGPMIFHGKTLTSKISLREVCRAIIKYGFIASPYPIIISAEVHCSVPQQELIAEIMIEVFGDALVRSISDAPGPTTGLESVKVQKIESLPSPEELKGKILLKTKHLTLPHFPTTDGNVDQAHPADVTTDFYSTEPSSLSDSDMGTRRGGKGVKHLSESASGSMLPTPTVVPNLPVITRENRKQEKGKSKSEDGGVKGQLNRAGASFLSKIRGVGRSSSSSLPIKIRGHRSSGSTSTIISAPAIGLSQSPPMMPPTQLVQSPSQQSDSNTSKSKPKMSPNLVSLLVYTVGVRFRGLNKKEYYAPEHMFSLSENVLMGSGGAWDLIKHTRTHLVRIYPKGTRLNSSNYLPNKFWAVGAQLVALNWQTFDLGFTINQAMFLRNGRSGYVLKPAVLRPQVIPTYPPHHRECVDHSPSRHKDQHQHLAQHHLASQLHLHRHHSSFPLTNKELLATRTWYHLDITIISAQQLPRPKDASGREVPGRAIVDPYVEVTVHVPDGPLLQKGSGGGSGSGGLGAGLSLKRGRSRSRPRYVSVDRKRSTSRKPQSGHDVKANGATPSFMVDDKGTWDLHSAHQPEPNGSSAIASVNERVVTKHTGVVKRNGFNPVWEEKLRLTFDCVGDMLDLAFVRFAVKQEDGAKHETDEGLAVYCAPVGCLGMGYRHLPLNDSQLSQYLYSTLFVKINLSWVGEGEQCD
ncbi:PLC-like phosphodiesterase [Panaeolus papilionaceus]|nr:PLC-like phosphodiesterase [Panaeolus papilionaceus]